MRRHKLEWKIHQAKFKRKNRTEKERAVLEVSERKVLPSQINQTDGTSYRV